MRDSARRPRSADGAAALVVAVLLACTTLGALAQADVLLEFTPGAAASDALPAGWEPLTFRKIDRHTRYAVVREGGEYVLRADSERAASAVYRAVDLDPRVYRSIAWRWKIENVLVKGDARRKQGDDYAARIYVAFRYDPESATLWERTRYGAIKLLYGRYPPRHAINYIWDNRLPVGTELENAYTDRTRMIVVESGAERVGRWVAEERDLYADYRRLFGEEPPPIAGVAVMTDTDDTGEHAVAYYGAIRLGPPR